MDIKLKNIKYSMKLKITASILIWLCFISVCGSSIFLVYNYDVISSKSYYDSYKFGNNFSNLSYNLIRYAVTFKSEKDIRTFDKKASDISSNLAEFHDIENELHNTTNFLYYIKNVNTKKVITNITGQNPIAFIRKQSCFSNLDCSGSGSGYVDQSDYQNSNCFYLRNEIVIMLDGKPYEAYAAVRKPLRHGDAFYNDFKKYSKTKTISFYVIMVLAASALLSLICSIYLTFVCGRNENKGEIQLLSIDRIYTDVHTLLVIIAAWISLNLASGADSHDYIFAFVILGIDALIGLSYILSMIRQFKNKTLIKNSLVYKIVSTLKRLIQLSFGGKIFKASTVLFLLGYGFINSILFFITLMAIDTHPILFLFCGFLLLTFNIFAINITVKALSSLTQLMSNVKEISNGNLEQNFDKSKISIAFMDFAKDIESIKSGLKKAVETAIKGERMKTELITNVSHDLKTPLTSIVNYVDLLKKEDLSNENAANYINILEEKSSRLKQLIEDLVEASKASSGNLAVNPEKVDLHELIMQACGEYAEKLKNAGLEIHIKTNEQRTLITADGRHMWRIIENLLTNIIKYSMPNSRVYINIDKNAAYGVLTFKNISAFPLDIPPEQLTERFVRGDVSRNTEGSGLGLSITQSLADLQNGNFKVDIDGDLFKVTISIPLWAE